MRSERTPSLSIVGTAFALTGALAASQIRSVESKPFIAFRYDAERVLVYTAHDTARTPPDPQQPRGVPAGSRQLASPLARYPGPHVVELPPPPQVSDRPGDRWTIDAAPGLVVTATTERSIFGGGDCVGLYGVIVRVDEPWREAFRAVVSRYHIAQRGDSEPRREPSPLGQIPGALDPALRTQVETVIRPALAEALPEVMAAASYARPAAAATGKRWAAEWQRVDAVLLRGKGTLVFDVQRFRLTPDADPRLYVRADLRVEGRSAFMMWFWLREASGGVRIEHRSAEAARHIRIGEFSGRPLLPLSFMGEILGVVDQDRDGQAEILVAAHYYEGHVIKAYEYAEGGLRASGAAFEWGC